MSLFATTSEKTFKSHAILTICRYTDKMVFTLTDTGAQACKIEACSESQVFSIGDAGTNCVFAFSVMSPHSPYPYSCPKCATALSTSPQLITSRAHSLTHSLTHARNQTAICGCSTVAPKMAANRFCMTSRPTRSLTKRWPKPVSI